MALARQFGASPAEMEFPQAVCETHPIFVQISSPVFPVGFPHLYGPYACRHRCEPLFFLLKLLLSQLVSQATKIPAAGVIGCVIWK